MVMPQRRRRQSPRSGPHRAQRDPARPQFEEFPCRFAGDGDGDFALFQAAVANDKLAHTADLERVFSSSDCASRPLDLCGPESLVSRHPVHDALYRLFAAAFRAVHFHTATESLAARTIHDLCAIFNLLAFPAVLPPFDVVKPFGMDFDFAVHADLVAQFTVRFDDGGV